MATAGPWGTKQMSLTLSEPPRRWQCWNNLLLLILTWFWGKAKPDVAVLSNSVSVNSHRMYLNSHAQWTCSRFHDLTPFYTVSSSIFGCLSHVWLFGVLQQLLNKIKSHDQRHKNISQEAWIPVHPVYCHFMPVVDRCIDIHHHRWLEGTGK